MNRFTILAALAILLAPSLLFSSEVDDYFFAASSSDFVDENGGKTFNGYDVFVVGIPSVGGGGGIFSVSRASSGSSRATAADASLIPNQVQAFDGSDYSQRSYRASDGSTFTVTYVYAAEVDGELVILSNESGIADVLKRTFEENPDFFNSFKSLTSQSAMTPSVADVNLSLVQQAALWGATAAAIGAQIIALLIGVRLLMFFALPKSSKETKADAKKEKQQTSYFNLEKSKEGLTSTTMKADGEVDEEFLSEDVDADPLFGSANFQQPSIYPDGFERYDETRKILNELGDVDAYLSGAAYGVEYSEKVLESNAKLKKLWDLLSYEEKDLLLDELRSDFAFGTEELEAKNDYFSAGLRRTHLEAALNGVVDADDFNDFYNASAGLGEDADDE